MDVAALAARLQGSPLLARAFLWPRGGKSQPRVACSAPRCTLEQKPSAAPLPACRRGAESDSYTILYDPNTDPESGHAETMEANYRFQNPVRSPAPGAQ